MTITASFPETPVPGSIEVQVTLACPRGNVDLRPAECAGFADAGAPGTHPVDAGGYRSTDAGHSGCTLARDRTGASTWWLATLSLLALAVARPCRARGRWGSRMS